MNALVSINKIENLSTGDLLLEQELLGSILITDSVFAIIEPLVSASDFVEPLHSQLFETFANIRETAAA
jgi:replicative DNA helicase